MSYASKLWVGIDWATELHQVCVLNHSGALLTERAIRHHPEELGEMCAWLAQLSTDQESEVCVAIEIPHGPLVEVLVERGIAVYAINPKQLDRFRDRFSPSGAKDDRRDALVLADSLRTDMRAFRLVRPDSAWIIELREYSRIRSNLVEERTKLANRLRAQLGRFYPAFLDCFPDLSEAVALDMLKVAPHPEAARKLKVKKVAQILSSRRIRRIQAEELVGKLSATSFVVSPGTIDAAVAHSQLLVQRLELLASQLWLVEHEQKKRLKRAEEESNEAEIEQRAVKIMLSMPGIGTTVCVALLAGASRLLCERDYQGLRTVAGVAPVTKCSGKKHIVLMRRACRQDLRDAVYHMARTASQHDPTSKKRYQELRARGHGHARALRTVADRLLFVLCAMLRDGTTWKPKGDAPATAA